MKNKILISFFSVVFTTSILWSQTTAIQDINFEKYLETHDAIGNVVNIGDDLSLGDGVENNGLVFTNRINAVVILNVSNLSINTLSGIEDFTSLETLICNSNNLVNLDVSNNTNLKSLLCGSNQLSSLDIRSNSNLEDLDCSSNQIAMLILQEGNVAGNPLLKELTCSNNRLSSIDVSENTNLTFLAVSSNQLNNLLVNNNVNLESLYCASNQITTLDLSANTNLKVLDASNNLISNLNLSTINTVVCPNPQTNPLTICQGASSINVSNNQLTSLIIANGFNDLIATFNSESNPDLFCIQVDAGFTPTSSWLKDDWTYYAETTCTDIYTYVPDANFEQALIDLSLDDVLDNLVLTSNINSITTLNVSNLNISSLIGIEDFVALNTLNCSTNNIEEINLFNNTALTSFNGSANSLINLDLSSNSALTVLDVSNNTLTVLDLSNTVFITNLNCSNNNIQFIDLRNHLAITDFNCESNTLEVLNIQNGQNGSLTNFSAINNNLSCIKTDTGTVPVGVNWTIDATAFYAINCGTYIPDNNFELALINLGLDTGTPDNYVPTANIIAETNLDISNSNIVDLTGIEDFTALAVLDCSNNNIIEINLTTNTALTSITCNNNALEFLDIRNGTNNPQLTTFNATNNPSLFCINVDDSNYSTNEAGWQEDVNVSYNSDCENNRYTPIPNDNFEQALVDLGLDSGVLDNQVLTANIEHIISLNISSKNIESLEGIKAFLSLTELDCSNNYLNELDVSNMVNLEALYCGSNYFLTNNTLNTNGLLNTTATTSLTKLFCANNNLNDLNISPNVNLEELDCSNNNLTNLDISNNILLVELNCNNNKISDLTTLVINNTSLKTLSCNANNLSTLNINNYVGLTTLNCNSNALTLLNITPNNALEILDFSDNDLANINLSNKTNLISVSGSQNQFTNIDDLASPLLESLIMDNNQISQLTTVLNNLPAIKYLSISNNQLTNIDVSTNTNLIKLNVSFNTITNLILPSNLNQLKTFNCNNNMLGNGFDLSTMGIGSCPAPNPNNPQDFCPDSITINVSNNQLKFVNIQNGINIQISNFNTINNPDLTCVQVDDVNNIGVNWVKDATTQYSLDCRFGETYVPDNNFEQALITMGYDAGALDDYVPTANINTLTTLDVSGQNISDFIGIQDFIALQNLNCSDNALTTINLSKLVDLIEIDCSNNTFSDLDFSNNVSLITINSSSNTLSSLDLSANTNLVNLNISNNLFSEFNPNAIPTLAIFNCDSNQIIELDFQTNTALINLSCQSNILEILNIKNGQNSNLSNLNAQNNSNLTCIKTDTGAMPNGVTWLKDITANYAINCFYGLTYIPDNNFEEALINLGYDDVLDDYVVTNNIENISFLDISNQDILDLTGIEGFLSLTNLNFEENTVVNVDLNRNALLQTLNVAGNALTVIDVSMLLDLITLNVSNNSLSQLNLDSNVNITDLNVSNNALTILNVDLLASLETLNSAFNQLSSLNVTLNPSLKILYCQSNLFVGDQLNIQNGANPNLQICNATNNPDLRCILVDDPFTVISNTDGTYDNWTKDTTANYQTICADADNDGIANADDQCPNTPFGATVDLFGCSTLNLPNDNFTVLITGETCLNSNNGKIIITAKEIFNYTATVTGDDFSKTYHFTNDIDILNLLAGTYQMCITIAEWPNFENCYTIVISQPEPLFVSTGKSSNGKKVSLVMSGSSNYNINFNGLAFSTSDSALTLNLKNGTNSIKVSTDLECQGVYEERILVSDNVFVYPNPFQNEINLYLGNTKKETVEINMFSYLGQLVYFKTFVKQNESKLAIDSSKLSAGIYTVSVKTKTSFSTFKIVKK